MDTADKLSTGIFAFYIIAAFLTFGHVANHTQPPCWGSGDRIVCDQATPYFAGAFAGIGWPIYWTGRVALEVTQ